MWQRRAATVTAPAVHRRHVPRRHRCRQQVARRSLMTSGAALLANREVAGRAVAVLRAAEAATMAERPRRFVTALAEVAAVAGRTAAAVERHGDAVAAQPPVMRVIARRLLFVAGATAGGLGVAERTAIDAGGVARTQHVTVHDVPGARVCRRRTIGAHLAVAGGAVVAGVAFGVAVHARVLADRRVGQQAVAASDVAVARGTGQTRGARVAAVRETDLGGQRRRRLPSDAGRLLGERCDRRRVRLATGPLRLAVADEAQLRRRHASLVAGLGTWVALDARQIGPGAVPGVAERRPSLLAVRALGQRARRDDQTDGCQHQRRTAPCRVRCGQGPTLVCRAHGS